MLLPLSLAAVLLFFGIVAYFLRIIRLRETQAMFRRYNEAGDLRIITSWVNERQPAQRLVRILDYLHKIEHEELAIQVFNAFPDEQLKQRHTRIFACRAFARSGQQERALGLARELLSNYPNDDAILELFLDVHLEFGAVAVAKPILEQGLSRKFKGTVFLRFKSQLMAAEGDLAEAVKLLETVVKREHILYVNTFAQPQKRLIYEQFAQSKVLLESYRDTLSTMGESPASGSLDQ